jgi:hypothetical protein
VVNRQQVLRHSAQELGRAHFTDAMQRKANLTATARAPQPKDDKMNDADNRPAVVGQVERPVGRLEPERDSGGMTYRWLVEKFTPEGQSTGLYMACQVNMTLTADVNAARKFRRQRTAEFRALDMREARRGDWRAVEHGFDDSKPPNCWFAPASSAINWAC